ncbi:hypothetical protein GGX14DRAFT_408615 [Mycena pura]|uniref:Uncharacterized protein n=1 Tax=Mycena pura TaxID=153505 RepID=A0AAD6UPT2_9AGAR|nr:hypothetical protein GGX14DRAFT_408615 [Mycena pura]
MSSRHVLAMYSPCSKAEPAGWNPSWTPDYYHSTWRVFGPITFAAPITVVVAIKDQQRRQAVPGTCDRCYQGHTSFLPRQNPGGFNAVTVENEVVLSESANDTNLSCLELTPSAQQLDSTQMSQKSQLKGTQLLSHGNVT